MEIRILFYYVYISCVLRTYTDAKPISLNDIIAAERQASQSPGNIVATPDNYIPQNKKTSLLKYKKAFQIASPAKPKKLKHLQKPRNKRKKLTSKREIQNEKSNKYIPLLRNIGMLFDNILSSGSSETYNTRKYKRNQFSTDDRDDVACTCASKYDPEERPHPQKKTTSTPFTAEVENEAFNSVIFTTTQTHNFADDNISGVGRNKDVPLLLTRNTSSLRRNNYRLRERSGSSYNRSSEGYITGVHRDYEYPTVGGERESDTQYYEENTNSHTRNNTHSHRSNGGIRGIGTDSRNSKINTRANETEEFVFATNETVEDVTRNLLGHEGKIEFEIRRNETESGIFLPEFTSRLREYNSQEKNTSIGISESNEKGFAYDYASNKRVSGRNGSATKENKKDSRTDKTMTPLQTLSNSSLPIGKVVMIFDGYSVAMDVNGKNKRNEKAIHIHS